MSAEASVLVVDDDAAVATVLTALLRQAGHGARHVASAAAALDVLRTERVDVLITDVRMPGLDGMSLLRMVRAEWADVPVVVLTGHATVPLAVEAMKAGAADFVTKPFEREAMLGVVAAAVEAAGRLGERPPERGVEDDELIGRSAAIERVRESLRKVAPTRATVLLYGETGTGKELAARALHRWSDRRDGPLVVVNCAALPEPLIESELFGHEKGAFTGAAARKLGRIELADRGTLFLDEIAELPLTLQPKLLRAIQEREVRRVGGTVSVTHDVRFVAATHRDLPAMIEQGRFRADLFHRLNVVPIELPPLRARREDIALLASTFVAEIAREHDRRAMTLEPAAAAALAGADWPGNVRELRNAIERLVIFADGPTIGAADVQRELARRGGADAPAASSTSLDDTMRTRERDALIEALARSGNNRTLAARLLGISRRILYNKLAAHGL